MKTLLVSASALVLLAATPAYADCEKEMMKVSGELQKDKRIAEGYATGVISTGDVRRLRAAAMIFKQAGLEARCQDVVAGMKELATRTVDEHDKRRKAEGKKADIEARRKKVREARLADLKSAEPISSASMSIEELLGSSVRNLEDKTIGSVDDVVFRDGKIESVIIAHGGFLGIGTEHYKVEWSRLKVTRDGDTVVLPVSENDLEAMPKMMKEDGSWRTVADVKKDREMKKTGEKSEKAREKTEDKKAK